MRWRYPRLRVLLVDGGLGLPLLQVHLLFAHLLLLLHGLLRFLGATKQSFDVRDANPLKHESVEVVPSHQACLNNGGIF